MPMNYKLTLTEDVLFIYATASARIAARLIESLLECLL